VRDEGGEPLYWLGVQTDVTERKHMEEKLAYRALHDPLTGLPNRDLLLDRLGQALARAGRSGRKVAVLFMDLDNFKYVNDSLGHDAGDGLLVEVAERLRGSLRPADTVARLGGDEFVMLLEGLKSEADAEEAVARVTEAINRPVYLKDQEVFVTFSIGIAMNTPDEAHHDDLLRRADVAMYRAKNDGKDRHRVFDASMNASARVRLELASDLRRALARDELPIHYQPTVCLEGGRILGFEALVRWEHPRKGLILPAEFMPVAEETGLIVPMGRHTLREACRRAKDWQDGGRRPLTVSVNLSVRQLQDADLLADVSLALEESGLAPRDLILEITESALMGDVPKNVAVLRGLKALGVRIAIDDFGTGYSSLSYLERFPVDVVKVDRSFVGRLGRNAKGGALVCAVIDLARALDLDVVAEGVETAEQAEELARLGCEVAQGYHFASPLDPEEVSEFLLVQSQLL
jgi:diguanylate cyclase (GGDEF)-like protein